MKQLGRPLILTGLIVATFAFFSLTTDYFLSPLTLSNLVRHMAEVLLVALPMTAIMISGGIDLSVGSTLALSAVALGWTWTATGSMLLAVPAALAAGAAAGLLNGVSVAYLGIPPLLVTLATMSAYRGIALGVAGAESMGGYPEGFLDLGAGSWFHLPTQILLLIPCVLFSWLLMAKMPSGNQVYLIGCGERLASHTGVPVARRKLGLYVWSGFMAAVAGVLFVARVSTAKANYGTGMELNAIAAVVLGGTSISGGSGSLIGTVLGLLLIRLLQKGMEFNNVPTEWQTMAVGGLLIASSLGERLASWIGRSFWRRGS